MRELIKKEVLRLYPIKGFGAIEIGLHKFHNNTEKRSPSHSSKFIILEKDNNNWIITKMVSLHWVL
jgi:hypothetical protein